MFFDLVSKSSIRLGFSLCIRAGIFKYFVLRLIHQSSVSSVKAVAKTSIPIFFPYSKRSLKLLKFSSKYAHPNYRY